MWLTGNFYVVNRKSLYPVALVGYVTSFCKNTEMINNLIMRVLESQIKRLS